jgi:HlyD family secretion protein
MRHETTKPLADPSILGRRLILRNTEVAMSVTSGSDADGPPRVQLLGWARRALLAACLLATAVFAMWRLAPTGAAAPERPPAAEPAATPISPREFVRTLRVTGLTEATRSYVVAAPLQAGGGSGGGGARESLVITRLAPPGARVARGDVLVEFDSQNQEKAAFEKAAEYRDFVEQIAKKRAEHEAARVKDESLREQAANKVEHLELEVLKNEMLAAIKAEKNNQDLDEARQRLAALRASFDLKRQAAGAELRVLEIKRDRAKAAMEHAAANATALTIRSTMDGLIVPRQMWKGAGPADVQEGDQLWPGSPVLEVVNQASMQVRARVNQVDMPHIRPGQPVTVRLDAYPDLVLPGRIAQIAPIALPGSFSKRVRTFSAIVAVEGTSDRLLPDLTAAVDVELERVHDALVVWRDAVRLENGRSRVRVRTGSGIASRDVTLGPGDDVRVVVTGGLRAGEEVLR